jgi:MoaA/NifB/PqqE/SkfB family radical SAM enzyme
MNETATFERVTKGFRRDIPPHRVCITWLINNKCNYRCTYCLNGFEEPPRFRVLSAEEWLSVWGEIYNKYGTTSIQITGGEPTVYPNFFEIMNNVGKMHYVELQTNLSWEPQELIDKVSCECVSRIGGSFHPQYAEFRPFLNKMVKLQEAGFKVEINYVAYPPLLKEAENRINEAKEKQVQLSILSFQGEYQGKKYPENYNEEERQILKNLNVSSGESAEAMADWDVEKKKIGTVEEARAPLRVCRMGQMYTWIKPDGEAMRCCKSNTVLGNIIDKTFNLLDEAQGCSIKNCICWRNMTVGEEARWVDRWPGTKGKAKD